MLCMFEGGGGIWDFYFGVDRDLVDKNIVYFIVCFKNKRMYNLMMADIAAETFRC